ncbi:MAG: class I SAM-dependent methyltransferase [Chitinophagaceae bacterium]|nr:class I SAM-dependent methyltransferase [Chitinophagaceae bacterium]MBL0200416.1 class I SAM-dependent methyltransferase [Chitinophagaceae bacterium]
MEKIYSWQNNHYYHAYWEEREQAYKQSLLFPKSTYSPWLNDELFMKTYDVIKDNTLVDIYRCFELWQISKRLKNSTAAIIEVGVWRGGTAALLAKANNNNSPVYLCDTFEGVAKAGEKDNQYKGGEHADTSIETVEKLMSQVGISGYHILKGIFPDVNADKVADQKFKICHIDVDVYDSAKDIFNWVWQRMIVGGVVVFDDYGFAACAGITQLVNELADSTTDAFFVHNINGHGLLIKTAV